MCHVETHIEGVTHGCNICSKTFKTRNSLDKHKYTYHKGEHKQLTQTDATIFQSCMINCVWKINPFKHLLNIVYSYLYVILNYSMYY